jgi:hypothetical protein
MPSNGGAILNTNVSKKSLVSQLLRDKSGIKKSNY